MAAQNQSTLPHATDSAAVARKFSELSERWRRETALVSNVERIVLHPAYQRIIGMGREAVPLILQEISTRPGHWFWALNAITGEDPVHEGATFREAIDAWLNWGRANGYI
jgi:hypothetical protein